MDFKIKHYYYITVQRESGVRSKILKYPLDKKLPNTGICLGAVNPSECETRSETREKGPSSQDRPSNPFHRPPACCMLLLG